MGAYLDTATLRWLSDHGSPTWWGSLLRPRHPQEAALGAVNPHVREAVDWVSATQLIVQ